MHAPRLAVQTRRFAEQKAREVEHMTSKVGQNKLFEFGEKGLILKNRESRNEINTRPKGFANHSAIEDLFEDAHGGLPTKIFVNEERHTECAGVIDHFLGLLQGWSHRFLANHWNFAFRCKEGEARVRIHVR